MPQATIKLQPAPAASAVRKPAEASPAVAATAAKAPEKPDAKVDNTKVDSQDDGADTDTDTESSSSELPTGLVIAVAALALVAFGIQLWTFLF